MSWLTLCYTPGEVAMIQTRNFPTLLYASFFPRFPRPEFTRRQLIVPLSHLRIMICDEPCSRARHRRDHEHLLRRQGTHRGAEARASRAGLCAYHRPTCHAPCHRPLRVQDARPDVPSNQFKHLLKDDNIIFVVMRIMMVVSGSPFYFHTAAPV